MIKIGNLYGIEGPHARCRGIITPKVVEETVMLRALGASPCHHGFYAKTKVGGLLEMSGRATYRVVCSLAEGHSGPHIACYFPYLDRKVTVYGWGDFCSHNCDGDDFSFPYCCENKGKVE